MAMAIFMIHLFGDFKSAEIVGHLSDRSGSLKLAVLVLPAALLVGGALWLGLGLKTLYGHPRQAPGAQNLSM
jgi:hypothetical protein